ncbi:MAG TPA: grasp-with-spasm system ATP-grasp peptide maturase [Bacteroidia bacterium]|nr:grasp-with-spasm system ATP-grasp peptide maturase [Bacteroidia bacterium]
MILIISINYEQSTSEVAEWLLYYKTEFEIVTETNTVKQLSYSLNEEKKEISIITQNGKSINFKDVESVWYRRNKFMNGNGILNDGNDFIKDVDYFIQIAKAEWKYTDELLLLSLKDKMLVGDHTKSDPNKIVVLELAKSLGLLVPDSIITSQKKDLLNNEWRLINKNISNVAHTSINNKSYCNRTVEVNVDHLPETFFPALFQKLIIKKYELRVFFLKDKFYAMAIFSQADDKTATDFRNYNYLKPNRTVPFELPEEIQIKLKKLMLLLEMNTGSIDMMVTPTDEYVFLEVNLMDNLAWLVIPAIIL